MPVRSLTTTQYKQKHNIDGLENLNKFLSILPPPDPTLDQGEVVDIPLRDGTVSQIRIFRPKVASQQPRPLIVLIYGGGFILGDNTQLSSVSRVLANLYSAVAVNISYRLAPTHKFPTAAQDAYDSVRWLSQNPSTLGADLSKGFVLLGASAGANLAAVVAQKWFSGKSSPPITGLSLAIPWLLSEEIVPQAYKHLWFSRNQNENAMILNKGTIDYMLAAYEPDVHSADFSPFNHPAPHSGMPPVYIQVCGADPLRDDGLIYEQALRFFGVKTKLDVYPGVPHGFSVFWEMELAKKSFSDQILAIGWLLGVEKTREDVQRLNESIQMHQ
ncbi:unnamed protein product [Alternaria alternata]|uniref:Alpha/beta hydrolase fold-3 domain-containing protein n=1 Tax=Alternaria tenuissima TaxID=119927 RepID=A0A4Q4MM67_9PLEO|nr:hypothetical protein AA0114_g3860 [Alternaria tenuissima]